MPRSSRPLDPDNSFSDWAASELRRWIRLKNLTQIEVADVLGRDRSLIGKIERGESPMQEVHAERLDAAWPETGGFFTRVVRYGKRRHSDSWEDEQEDLQRESKIVRIWSLGWVPALLQTEATAAAVFGAVPGLDVSAAVANRMEQQRQVMEQDRPPIIRALVDQGALEVPVGGPDVHRQQIEHLLTLTQRMTIRVVPTGIGAHLGRDGSFMIFTTQDGKNHPYTATLGPGRLVHDPDDIATYELAFDVISDRAASVEESVRMLERIKEHRT